MSLLRYPFLQQALVASVVVCAVAPLVGAFLVQRRQSLTGDGIGHVAFAGVGLAFLLGVSPLAGALALSLLAVLGLRRLDRLGLAGDLALALLFYGGIAFGFLITARSGNGAGAVLGFLFGSPLTLTWPQVAAVVALALGAAVVVLALYRPLTAMAFDELTARVAGLPVEGLSLALTCLVAAIVVGGMYALGLLLISAMMVIPVAAAAQVARSYRSTLALSSGVGALSAAAGLLAAFVFDLSPGAAIVLCAIGAFVVLATAGRLRTVPGVGDVRS